MWTDQILLRNSPDGIKDSCMYTWFLHFDRNEIFVRTKLPIHTQLESSPLVNTYNSGEVGKAQEIYGTF